MDQDTFKNLVSWAAASGSVVTGVNIAFAKFNDFLGGPVEQQLNAIEKFNTVQFGVTITCLAGMAIGDMLTRADIPLESVLNDPHATTLFVASGLTTTAVATFINFFHMEYKAQQIRDEQDFAAREIAHIELFIRDGNYMRPFSLETSIPAEFVEHLKELMSRQKIFLDVFHHDTGEYVGLDDIFTVPDNELVTVMMRFSDPKDSKKFRQMLASKIWETNQAVLKEEKKKQKEEKKKKALKDLEDAV